jgi:hypothetical protein
MMRVLSVDGYRTTIGFVGSSVSGCCTTGTFATSRGCTSTDTRDGAAPLFEGVGGLTWTTDEPSSKGMTF